MTYIVAGIFARGGSKGLPRKNVKLLNGKPLIAHAIVCAKQSKHIDYLFVSTDDEEIASVAREWGADVPFMRPAELASDTSAERLSWQHAIQALERLGHPPIDAFVSVPATAPLRLVEDVDSTIELLLNSDADIVITVTDAHSNPYFTMVTLDAQQTAHLVMRDARFARRQDAPKVYDITPVAYAARVPHVLHATAIFDGKVKAVHVPPERAIDIDVPLDFKIAELLLKEREG